MSTSKTEYILNRLKKVVHKEWEIFIISRILHGLSDDSIEFVTQQLVRLPEDQRRFYTDLYFPQFGIHLEIDERHHLNQEQEDALRERDILHATGHQIERIIAHNRTLRDVRENVDHFIQKLVAEKKKQEKEGVFKEWDWEGKYSAEKVIEVGYMDVRDNVTFRRQTEAMKCFGFLGTTYRRGGWTIPDGSGDFVWFPRLFRHYLWDNALSRDGRHIFERPLSGDKELEEQAKENLRRQLRRARAQKDSKFIVCAKAKDSLGENVLRYIGTFQINIDASSESEGIQFDLVRTRENVRINK